MILMMWNQNDIVRGELKNISFDIKADVSPDKEEHLIVFMRMSVKMLDIGAFFALMCNI